MLALPSHHPCACALLVPWGPSQLSWCKSVAGIAGQEIVFHCAAACPTNAAASNQALMVAVNVDGSRNVIAACQRMGVPRLVYTSSASVVFEGRNLHGADERLPYASRPMDFYTGTKVCLPFFVTIYIASPSKVL